MDTLKKINFIFSRKQKIRLLFLMVIMLIGSVLELVGIAAIMPFVNVISDTSIIHNRKAYRVFYDMFNCSNDTQFILIFAAALIFLYIFKNLYIIAMFYIQYRFTYHNQQKFTSIMMDCYMKQPYLFHVMKNISELHRNVTSDVQMLFATVLSVIQLINEMTVCFFVLIYLFVIDKYITLGLLIMLCIFAFFFLKVMRKKTGELGIINRDLAVAFSKWIKQGFEGIKEIKIVNREQFYIDNINYYGTKGADVTIQTQTINAMPRPLFEAVCISSLMGIVFLKIANGADIRYFIPVLSAFAVAAVRLLPSAGRITTHLTTIQYNKAAVNNVYKDLVEIANLKNGEYDSEDKGIDLTFDRDININNVTFSYPSSAEPVLENINLVIKKNSSIALVGPSGAGKTTLADIILGLLRPQGGSILCDDVDVYDNLRGWHKFLGYIPQSIYLIDDTIRNNILFGIPEKESSDDKVWEALESAQLADFVRGLDNGLDTMVGERGVRLSGGQRQRIGIARALYNKPQILVLDEATSALDTETETAVMESIDALHGNRTMIIIAHRLTTIRNCDYIYEIKEKKANLCNKDEILAGIQK